MNVPAFAAFRRATSDFVRAAPDETLFFGGGVL
jgi:hypothetical protein